MNNIINKLKVHNSKILKLALFSFLLFLCPSILLGQSLVDLQNEAVKNRKFIEKLRIEISKRDVDLKIVNSANWPKLDIDYSISKIDSDPDSSRTKYSEFETILSYPVFSGYKYYYQKHFVKKLKTSKEFELNSIIQDLKFLISAHYLHIFDTNSLLKVAEDEYNLLEKRYKDALSRHKVGLIKKNDMLKIKVELDNATQKKEKARAEFEKSISEMEHDTGIKIDFKKMKFEEFNALPDVKSLVFYLSKAARRNEIKALEQLIIAGDLNVKSLKSNYYPSIDMSLEYFRSDEDYLLGMGDIYENDMRVKLNLKMNVFNGYKDTFNIKSHIMDIKMLECDLEELQKKLAYEVEKYFLDYEVSLKNLKIAHSSISQAEENLKTTDMSFNQGVATTADVLDAIYYLSRSKYNYIYAGGELFLNYYKLTRLADAF